MYLGNIVAATTAVPSAIERQFNRLVSVLLLTTVVSVSGIIDHVRGK